MSHLTQQDRCIIENMLNAGCSPLKIAHRLKKAHSTIQREIKKHRQKEKSKRPRNYCSKKKTCMIKSLCDYPKDKCPGRCCVCKNINCFEKCSQYKEIHCENLMKSPFVCNGCHDIDNCKLRKWFYFASIAYEEYSNELHDCRQGINISLDELMQYNALIKTGTNNGQSVHHIINSHKDDFIICEKTVYNYYHMDILNVSAVDMPKMGRRKLRKKLKCQQHKVDPKCRHGRKLENYKIFQEQHPELPTVQIDSVIGSIGGKVLLTLQFECGMMLAWLRNFNNSQSVIDYFNMMEEKFGLEIFRKMFPIILTDNGCEFSNPLAIETSPYTGEQRTHVFFCDPNASWQKGSIENNHTNLRRIIPKSSSFDKLNQNDINLVLSHLNSYIRKSYNDIPAIVNFRSVFGEETLNKLGIHIIPPDNVIMEPKLLKGKI